MPSLNTAALQGGEDVKRKSHWVATRRSAGAREVFDINAMGVGGWISEEEWRKHMLPWIAKTYFEGAPGVTDIESFRL